MPRVLQDIHGLVLQDYQKYLTDYKKYQFSEPTPRQLLCQMDLGRQKGALAIRMVIPTLPVYNGWYQWTGTGGDRVRIWARCTAGQKGTL